MGVEKRPNDPHCRNKEGSRLAVDSGQTARGKEERSEGWGYSKRLKSVGSH
jgi:hypothetical protein